MISLFGTLFEAAKTRDRDAEGVEGGNAWGGIYPSPHPTR